MCHMHVCDANVQLFRVTPSARDTCPSDRQVYRLVIYYPHVIGVSTVSYGTCVCCGVSVWTHSANGHIMIA